MRVLEQIVTDGGIETAAQIEALRTAAPERREVPMNPYEIVLLIIAIAMIGGS